MTAETELTEGCIQLEAFGESAVIRDESIIAFVVAAAKQLRSGDEQFFVLKGMEGMGASEEEVEFFKKVFIALSQRSAWPKGFFTSLEDTLDDNRRDSCAGSSPTGRRINKREREARKSSNRRKPKIEIQVIQHYEDVAVILGTIVNLNNISGLHFASSERSITDIRYKEYRGDWVSIPVTIKAPVEEVEEMLARFIQSRQTRAES